MGLRTEFDADAIIASIEAVGRDQTKAARQALLEGARDIRDTAREYAPVDDHDLEKSIKVERTDGGNQVHIGIDPMATDELGRSVAGYGMMMHEMQAIGGGSLPRSSGMYGLGPKSQAKDGGRGVVGGKFLERAFNEHLKQIMRNTAIKVKRAYKTVTGGEDYDE